ncbi:hypothetical protein K458DRAFT_382239 [Lentithecium fluviatile CBS 122367]|uniref:Uncharacterized protein n=1 Tax=Lentithecium fluviatile CBS 122367 TaxID=1168545 RepID=A0A6G1JJD2_9PLEO|nr:hypothetical protein K458DRAFT_382239 [Lentithecium fluviatile CBS 122367]
MRMLAYGHLYSRYSCNARVAADVNRLARFMDVIGDKSEPFKDVTITISAREHTLLASRLEFKAIKALLIHNTISFVDRLTHLPPDLAVTLLDHDRVKDHPYHASLAEGIERGDNDAAAALLLLLLPKIEKFSITCNDDYLAPRRMIGLLECITDLCDSESAVPELCDGSDPEAEGGAPFPVKPRGVESLKTLTIKSKRRASAVFLFARIILDSSSFMEPRPRSNVTKLTLLRYLKTGPEPWRRFLDTFTRSEYLRVQWYIKEFFTDNFNLQELAKHPDTLTGLRLSSDKRIPSSKAIGSMEYLHAFEKLKEFTAGETDFFCTKEDPNAGHLQDLNKFIPRFLNTLTILVKNEPDTVPQNWAAKWATLKQERRVEWCHFGLDSTTIRVEEVSEP